MLIHDTVTSNGIVTYSEVREFLEKDFQRIVNYKSIKTLRNESLTLSENHLVFARKEHNDDFKPM